MHCKPLNVIGFHCKPKHPDFVILNVLTWLSEISHTSKTTKTTKTTKRTSKTSKIIGQPKQVRKVSQQRQVKVQR